MAEGQTQETNGKKKTEITTVAMDDGRQVGFAGQRKMMKETIIDEGGVIVNDDGSVTLRPGAVAVRIDFRNGKSVQFTPPAQIIAKSIGHGLEQKLGDEAASEKDVDDAYMAIDDLANRLSGGEWNVARESGGFSGASVVVRAIMEASGKSQEEVKAFLDGKIKAAEARGEKLSRKSLYDSFRKPGSKTGDIIERMEKEKLSKNAAVDADQALDELSAA